MSEPFSDAPKKVAEDQAKKNRALILAYKSTFSNPKGKLVLDDLKHRFGFGKWEAIDTEDADKIARRVCAKGALYHIQNQLDHIFTEKRTPKRALSASTNAEASHNNEQ